MEEMRDMEQIATVLPPTIRHWLGLLDIDFMPRHAQPTAARWTLALIVANLASLCSDAILVAVGTSVFPSTRGFSHFQFSDYAKLTIVGVTIACIAWPIVTRLSSQPRRLFVRLTVLVTAVSWLPDLYILLVLGEPVNGVAVLMLMHLAIAFITYNAVIRIAPVRDSGR